MSQLMWLAAHPSNGAVFEIKCAVQHRSGSDGRLAPLNAFIVPEIESMHKNFSFQHIHGGFRKGSADRTGYPCPHCDYLAKWPTELQKHIMVHSKERPHQCVICGLTYKWKWDLGRHFDKCHNHTVNPYKKTCLVVKPTLNSPQTTRRRRPPFSGTSVERRPRRLRTDVMSSRATDVGTSSTAHAFYLPAPPPQPKLHFPLESSQLLSW